MIRHETTIDGRTLESDHMFVRSARRVAVCRIFAALSHSRFFFQVPTQPKANGYVNFVTSPWSLSPDD
jgi:hypothetical protein